MEASTKCNSSYDANENPVAKVRINVYVLVNGVMESQGFDGIPARTEVVASDQTVNSESSEALERFGRLRWRCRVGCLL